MSEVADKFMLMAERAFQQRDELRVALSDLVAAFVNPGDGGQFEDGEVPALDRARSILGQSGIGSESGPETKSQPNPNQIPVGQQGK